MTPATMGERVADLEARVKSAEDSIQRHDEQHEKATEFINIMKGEIKERDKQHTANQWRLNAIIGILGLLFAYETLIKDHHKDSPQKSSQAAPVAGHSELPSGYVSSLTPER